MKVADEYDMKVADDGGKIVIISESV